ncbi:ATP-dependent Zn protease [Vibrio sinensis]|uniref:ATP-dependent Zn protease n=1 Tax=Vibrio sinensis TaxID=2302434 RepID=A0A3A6QRA6_9VIBR|nr:ATP-dependent zinc protease [Vibrio sinensis]RJX75450.1 ATP-dependent Zn protease [Vibrio sinensis]
MKNRTKIALLLLSSFGLMACDVATNTSPKTDPNTTAQTAVVSEASSSDNVTKEKVETTKAEVVMKAKTTSDGKLILGEQEWVYIPGLKESFKARVDTGATTSSVSAVDIQPFERDGEDWVKFKIEHDGINSDEIELPVERWVKIRQSSAEGTQRRAVVVAWLQMGDYKAQTEFTLADRTHLTFPILLGRSFVNGVAVVDVSQKYIQDKHKE